MVTTQPEIADTIIAFGARAAALRTARFADRDYFNLTPMDRIAVIRWQEPALLAGYDRMVIHDRDGGDATEVGSFLSVYRCGDAWSRWGFARRGGMIQAWCCLSGADVGTFGSLADALGAVLVGSPAHKGADAHAHGADRRGVARAQRGSATVMDFMPRSASYRGPMGGAA